MIVYRKSTVIVFLIICALIFSIGQASAWWPFGPSEAEKAKEELAKLDEAIAAGTRQVEELIQFRLKLVKMEKEYRKSGKPGEAFKKVGEIIKLDGIILTAKSDLIAKKKQREKLLKKINNEVTDKTG